jgi:inner membrane transporter RhtA
VVGVVLLSPALLGTDTSPLGDPRILLLGAAVGLLSSVIPYSCELVALRRLPPALFGVLMSLEPAAAALAGLLVVGERLGVAQWLAIGCVVVASIGATRSTAPDRRPALAEPAPD